MVNTFVIGENTEEVLDYKRLGKQRVEAMQIYNILTGSTKKKGYSNHPAVKMWKGYENALGDYHNKMIREWIKRGYKNTMKNIEVIEPVVYPDWYYSKVLHFTHKTSLVRKNEEYYYDKFPDIPEYYLSYGYIWPHKFDGIIPEIDETNIEHYCESVNI